MTTSSPESVNLAVYFDDVRTLAEMIEVLTELESGYQECVRALEPPPGVSTSSPQISIRTGSLFVEFTAAVQSGAWSAAGLILFRALLTDTEPFIKVALFPLDLVGRISDKLHELRVTWRERDLVKRKWKIDDAARAALEAAKQDPAAGSLELDSLPQTAARGTSATAAHASRPAEGPSPRLAFTGDPTAIEVVQRALFDGAEFARGLQERAAGFNEDVDHLARFAVTVLGHLDSVAEVLGPLQAVHEHLDEVAGLLGVARDGLISHMSKF